MMIIQILLILNSTEKTRMVVIVDREESVVRDKDFRHCGK
jgi:hypothetical protein